MEHGKPGTAAMQVLPEYKARCIEWAIASKTLGNTDSVINAAKKFYAYVYEVNSGKP